MKCISAREYAILVDFYKTLVVNALRYLLKNKVQIKAKKGVKNREKAMLLEGKSLVIAR